MRKRTTWVSSKGASEKKAEDPRAMNQDHLQQQPSADKYTIGGPSEFAEDVHPSADTWESEDEGGETKRNEIGMPEFRDDTFKHAGVDMETLYKKGNICLRVARHMLPSADDETLEFQAAALMHLPDQDLVETVGRIQTAGKVPPEFLEQQEKMKEKAEDKKEEKEEKADKKEASENVEPEQVAEEETEEEKEEEEKEEEEKAQDKEASCGQMFSMEQMQEMVNQAVQAKMDAMQAPASQMSEVQSDEEILDQMLQDDLEPAQTSEMDLQLEGAPMNIDEVQFDQDESDVLSSLFANHSEVLQAQQAQTLQGGVPVVPVALPVTKNASTRTVGTRPSGGVSQIGGAGASAETNSNDVDSLSSMWKSAPDVSGVFNP